MIPNPLTFLFQAITDGIIDIIDANIIIHNNIVVEVVNIGI